MHLHRPEENNNKKIIYAHSKTTTSVYGTIPIIGADKNYLGNAPNVMIFMTWILTCFLIFCYQPPVARCILGVNSPPVENECACWYPISGRTDTMSTFHKK